MAKISNKKPAAKAAKIVPKASPKAAPKVESKSSKTPTAKVEHMLEDALEFEEIHTKKKDSKSKPKAKPTVVAKGVLVSIDYVGTLKTGEEFDNSKNHGPIQFVVGSGQVIKGFDTAVIGMKVGDSKKFTVSKKDGYGDSNPELVQVVPLEKVPGHIKAQLKVGGFLVMQSPTGQQIPAKVLKLDKTNVSLDMNHPLAGKELNFAIKVVDIDNAPEGGCCDDGCGSCMPDDGCGCGHAHK
jgi:peptidylprolyl isomerase